MSSEEIYSSTGRLGVSRRQDQRLYVNGVRFSNNSVEIAANFGRLLRLGEKYAQSIGRVCFRGVVNEQTLLGIIDSSMSRSLEVALELSSYGQNGWLVYLSRNRNDRQTHAPVADMVRQTEDYRAQRPTAERIASAVNAGYRFHDSIRSEDIDQIQSVWGPTFGWERQEVENLAQRLQRENALDPAQRSVWFSAVKEGPEVVSLSMAERLGIPGPSGTLDLIESTEWRTDDSHSGHGLMTANLTFLNAQILRDLGQRPSGPPLIFAECNYQTRSDWAGHGAGMEIPERRVGQAVVPQVLAQNVAVNDGVEGLPSGLRDFSFMCLTPSSIRRHYNPTQISQVMAISGHEIGLAA